MLRSLVMAGIVAFAGAAAVARADTAAPVRHLVYSFTYDSKQSGAVPNDPGAGGAASYSGGLNDMGTMTVDVLREAPDRGLVVVISEQGDHSRKSAAATCAVYGHTNVACDPTKEINREEYTLLRFLGVNFVDPNTVDANGRWSVSDNKGATKMTADYTIKTNDNGVLTIDERRHIEDTSQGSTTINAQTNINYNGRRLLPTSIQEYATEDRHAGVLGVTQTTYQTTFTLVSDSMSKQ